MEPTMMLITVLLTIALRYILQIYYKRKRVSDLIEPLNGPKWYPIIGTTLSFIKATREEFFEAYLLRNKTHGPFFRCWMGSHPSVHVMKPDVIETILTSQTNLTKGANYNFVKPWLGNGLITGTGNHWRRHRKLITPTFHFKILDNMTETVARKSQDLVNIVQSKADGKFFDIFPLLTHCALDIICETAMGVEINAMRHFNSEYVKAVYGITEIILHRTFHPYLHSNFIFNLTPLARQQRKYLSILHGFTNKVIQERKQKLENQDQNNNISEEDILLGKKKRLVFMDLLLEASMKENAGLTDEQIREEVDTFMFAGHDTTTVTVAWTLFTLANHPEIQERAFEELDSIFHGEERPITPQDVAQMQYLDRVVKETQRLIPAVAHVTRHIDHDMELNGRLIPAGVMAVIHIYELHRDPELFPDPEKFDPDRFLPEQSAKRHPYAFIPFSAGPRNCLGQKFAMRNAKVLLAAILRKYKVRSQKKIHEMKYYAEIVLRPQGGLHVSLEPRN